MDKNLEKLGRRSKEMESVRAIERRRLAIERTSARAPKKRIEHTCVHAQKKEIDHSAIDRRPTTIERTYA
jgi:hypothetical protein